MILDLPDLQKLSGYKRSADVKKWLHKNGISFMVQPSGHPVTTMDAVNLALSPKQRRTEPNWAALPTGRSRPAK
jgi:hypothetical protein